MNLRFASCNKQLKIVKILFYNINLERLGLSPNVLCFLPFKTKKIRCVVAGGKVIVLENEVAEKVMVEYV